MSITPFGYLFFSTILFGILLTIAVARRWRKNGKPIGIGGSIYIGLILVTISSLFFMFTFLGSQAVYSMITFPKYKATIISYDSRWEEKEYTDSDGDRYKRNVEMHTPTLQFVDGTGATITQRANYSSSGRPTVGDTVTIAFQDGKLLAITFGTVALYTGLGVMLLIFGYILLQVCFFAAGWKSQKLDKAGAYLLGYIVIGGGMLAMLAGLVYGGIYQYFQPGSNVPLLAMLVSVFFSLALALAFYAMFVQSKPKRPAD